MKNIVTDIEIEKAIDNMIPLYSSNDIYKYHEVTDEQLCKSINNMMFMPSDYLSQDVRNTCVYFHFKKDDGRIFYVGIGDGHRPYEKNDRNKFWHNVVDKHGYFIDIIQTNLTWIEACELERFYIAKYKRRDKHKDGLLVNLTDGGDGVNGYVHSADTKKKMKVIRDNKTPEQKEAEAEKTKQASIKMWSDENYEARHKKIMSSVYSDIAYREKKSLLSKQMWSRYTDEERKSRLDSHKKACSTTEYIQTHRDISKKMWDLLTEEEKEKRIEKQAEGRRRKESGKKAERQSKGIFTKQELDKMAFDALSEEQKIKTKKKGKNISEAKRLNSIKRAALLDNEAGEYAREKLKTYDTLSDIEKIKVGKRITSLKFKPKRKKSKNK